MRRIVTAVVCTFVLSSPVAAQGDARPVFTIGPAASALLSNEAGTAGWPDLMGLGAGATLSPGSMTAGTSALDYFALGAFFLHYPAQGEEESGGTHYGAELALHVLPSPAFGLIDPYLVGGAGVLDIDRGAEAGTPWSVFSAGVGFRVASGSRFELRADGRMIPRREVGEESKPGYFQFNAGLRLGF